MFLQFTVRQTASHTGYSLRKKILQGEDEGLAISFALMARVDYDLVQLQAVRDPLRTRGAIDLKEANNAIIRRDDKFVALQGRG